MLEVTFIVIGALFIILSLFLLSGCGSFLIAGYNTMSKDKKAQYDAKALCKFMGKMFLPMGILCFGFLIEGIIYWYTWVYLAITFVLVLVAVVYVNTGNRFKK